MSQLTNEADVQLAEVLVAVSDALVAANQGQTAGEEIQLVHTTPSQQVNQGEASNNVQIMETGEQEGIETDMNADQTVPIIASGEAESSQVCQGEHFSRNSVTKCTLYFDQLRFCSCSAELCPVYSTPVQFTLLFHFTFQCIFLYFIPLYFHCSFSLVYFCEFCIDQRSLDQ